MSNFAANKAGAGDAAVVSCLQIKDLQPARLALVAGLDRGP